MRANNTAGRDQAVVVHSASVDELTRLIAEVRGLVPQIGRAISTVAAWL